MTALARITIHDAESGTLANESQCALDALRKDNDFQPLNTDAPGPFDLDMAIADNRLVLSLSDAVGNALPALVLSIRPYSRLIRDYFMVIESYEQARRAGNHTRLEAIDMGRRGLHDEGANMLRDRLKDRISMDFSTARRLFTLICALHGTRGPVL